MQMDSDREIAHTATLNSSCPQLQFLRHHPHSSAMAPSNAGHPLPSFQAGRLLPPLKLVLQHHRPQGAAVDRSSSSNSNIRMPILQAPCRNIQETGMERQTSRLRMVDMALEALLLVCPRHLV